jgi:mercuric ion binding protein
MKTLRSSQATHALTSVTMALLLAGVSLVASAAPKTVTLSIPSMDCPVCPITVKKALSQVPGVSQANVSFEKRQAVVQFDDAKTDARALTESTKNAGYPSTLVDAAQ